MAKLPGELLLYVRAYRALERLTPLPGDCGELCGQRCCQGSDTEGMILFPHEEILLKDAGYRLFTEKMGGRRVTMAVCSGRCKRRLRPLSCRIYPFAPYYEGGNITVRPDPRATAVCPLLLPEAESYILPEFTETVRTSFEEMLRSSVLRTFLTDYTCMLRQYERFTSGLFKNASHL